MSENSGGRGRTFAVGIGGWGAGVIENGTETVGVWIGGPADDSFNLAVL